MKTKQTLSKWINGMRRKMRENPDPRFDVLELVKIIQDRPFNFKVRSFEVIGGREPIFMVEFDKVDPCARHELECALAKKGFDVHGGGTELEPGGASDISFAFKAKRR